MNEEFTGHCNEPDDVNEVPDDLHSSSSVDLERIAEHHIEEAIIDVFFNAEQCCPWTQVGRKFLQERLEHQELVVKEADIAVLSSLHPLFSLSSTTRERLRSSIKYLFEGMPICKTVLLFLNAMGAGPLKNLISHYDFEGLSVRVHLNSRKCPHNQTDD